VLPAVPTVKESGYDFEYALQVGIVIRKGTPPRRSARSAAR
jgi:tripartite-type tricarboxylate transporter receptor subunit TctC